MFNPLNYSLILGPAQTIDPKGAISKSAKTTPKYAVNTDYWQGALNADTKYGTFKTTDKNGVRYQPNNVGGSKLTKTGKTAAFNKAGLEQNVWKDTNGNYYYWEGYENKYKQLSRPQLAQVFGNPNATNNDSNTGGNSGDGGGSYNAPSGGGTNASTVTETKPPEVPKIDWTMMNVDEMADILGIDTYKYEDILKLYNNASNKKFDELDTQVKRTQADNLRALQGQYDTYLNTLRENRANAVSSGMTKGANAALQLASMYANAQSISQNQQALSDTLYDLGQQRATALAENETTASKDRKAIEQYLASLQTTHEANSVNELAARLAANSQVQAAQIQADATTKAAGINAAATKSAATATQDKVYGYYIKQFGEDLGNELYLRDLNSSNVINAYNAAGNLKDLGFNSYANHLTNYFK